MSEDTLKLAQEIIDGDHTWLTHQNNEAISPETIMPVAAALIDLHERMGRIEKEATKWGCNHEDEQDEDSRMCSGDDCKCCYILALTKGTK